MADLLTRWYHSCASTGSSSARRWPINSSRRMAKTASKRARVAFFVLVALCPRSSMSWSVEDATGGAGCVVAAWAVLVGATGGAMVDRKRGWATGRGWAKGKSVGGVGGCLDISADGRWLNDSNGGSHKRYFSGGKKRLWAMVSAGASGHPG